MIELKEKAPDLMRLSYLATRPPALIPNRTEFLRFWLLTSPLQGKHFHTLQLILRVETRISNAQTRFINEATIPFLLQ